VEILEKLRDFPGKNEAQDSDARENTKSLSRD